MSPGKRVKDLREFEDAARPLFVAAEEYFNECVEQAKPTGHKDEDWMKEKKHVAIALADGLLKDYGQDGVDIYESVFQHLEA